MPLVANFALIYIEMGLPRVTEAARATLVPRLLVGISGRPAAQQDSLLALLLAALAALPLPRTRAELGAAAAPPDAVAQPDAVAGTAGDGAGGSGVGGGAVCGAAMSAAPAEDAEPLLPFLVEPSDRALILTWLLDLLLYLPPLAADPHAPPPGLSRAAAKRVCGKLADHEVRGELLAAKKLAALRLLDATTADGTTRLFGIAER